MELEGDEPLLRPPFAKLKQGRLDLFSMVQPQPRVVRVADDDHIARRFLPPPLVYPEVEYIMQVEIGKGRRNHRPLRSPFLCHVPPSAPSRPPSTISGSGGRFSCLLFGARQPDHPRM